MEKKLYMEEATVKISQTVHEGQNNKTTTQNGKFLDNVSVFWQKISANGMTKCRTKAVGLNLVTVMHQEQYADDFHQNTKTLVFTTPRVFSLKWL